MRSQLVSTLLISTINFALSFDFAEYGSRTRAEKLSLRDTTPNTFDSTASSNIAVYFGRTNATRKGGLLPLCQDRNINIVVLAFITKIFAGGGYPEITFDQLCDGPTTEMRTEGATGLVSCVDLANDITACQSLGTKILIGIGGQNGNATFSSSAEAEQGANMLWNVFGGGNDLNTTLRPFGNVTVDGFDVDNETGDGSYYDDFVAALATISRQQSTKTYYLSAAPGCNYPYDGQPLDMLNLVDFVWPQFYGAPSCNIGSDGFNVSFAGWTGRLDGPKLYLGAPAFAAAVTNGGYQDPELFTETVLAARSLGQTKFGGVMLWDGPYAQLNRDSEGEDYVNVTKTALLQRSGSDGCRPKWDVIVSIATMASVVTISNVI